MICFFKIIMSICSDLIMFMFTSILTLRSSIRCVSQVIIALMFMLTRCMSTMTYLLIICLLESVSHTDMSIVIV